MADHLTTAAADMITAVVVEEVATTVIETADIPAEVGLIYNSLDFIFLAVLTSTGAQHRG